MWNKEERVVDGAQAASNQVKKRFFAQVEAQFHDLEFYMCF